MCSIFTLTPPNQLLNLSLTLQIMRKKTDVSTTGIPAGVSNKTIVKPSRQRSTPVTTVTGKKNSTLTTTVKDAKDGCMLELAGGIGVRDTGIPNSEDVSAGSSRDRSPTPLESDLLRYLTAHITPIHKQDICDMYADVTSFVIGRDEYLQGIVRLVQSDCPEVSGDLQCFVTAMQQAFCTVNKYGESK
jgi:hypothetical protein